MFWLRFCSEIKVKQVYPASDSEFNVFTPSKQLFDVHHFYIESGTFRFIPFFLIQGSKLKIHVNKSFITFIVIKSVYNLNKFEENIYGFCKKMLLKIHYSSTVDGRNR